MKINLSPIRSDRTLAMSKTGDILTINGEEFDFTPLPEGGLLPQDAIISEYIISDVERIEGVITLDVLFPLGPNASETQRFPDPINITADGEVVLPC